MEELRVLLEATTPTGGELPSAWFELPILDYEIEEKLGVEQDSGDYRILEKELPFADEVSEETSIDKLNDLYHMYQSLPPYVLPFYEDVMCYFSNLEELHHYRFDILDYPDCKNMTDLARHVLSINPEFQALSEETIRYFDFEAYGEYLDSNGRFLETEDGILEMP